MRLLPLHRAETGPRLAAQEVLSRFGCSCDGCCYSPAAFGRRLAHVAAHADTISLNTTLLETIVAAELPEGTEITIEVHAAHTVKVVARVALTEEDGDSIREAIPREYERMSAGVAIDVSEFASGREALDAPPPPPPATTTYCADEHCGAHLLAHRWVPLVEAGPIARSRFGSGHPPPATSVAELKERGVVFRPDNMLESRADDDALAVWRGR